MALKALHVKLSDLKINERYKIQGLSKINSIFSLLSDEQIHLNVLFEDNYKMLELAVINYDSNNKMFGIHEPASLSNLDLKKGHIAYFSFNMHTGTYYFKTTLSEKHEGLNLFSLPEIRLHFDIYHHFF